MTVVLRRAQIGHVKTGNTIDITVKSAVGWARAFAPTWDMVSAYKSGIMGESEYRNKYEVLLDAVGEEPFRRLWEFGDGGIVKLLCYCPNGKFCHSHLMIDFAVKRYPQWFSDGRISSRHPKAKTKVNGMKFLLAVDLETTGLKPSYHEITQVAAIILDKNLNELGTFETLVQIDNPERGIEGGFNVFEYTGLKLEDIQKGMSKKDMIRALETFARSKIGGMDLRQVVMFGQNPTFDKGFLEAAFEQQGWKFPFDFHVLALESMYAQYHLMRSGELPCYITLKDICKVAGVENKKKHNAMSDIRATVDALHKLCPSKDTKVVKSTPDEQVIYQARVGEDAWLNRPGPVPRRRNVGRK